MDGKGWHRTQGYTTSIWKKKGKPRTKRIRDAAEARGGNLQSKQCKLCKEFGQNKKDCPIKDEFS